MVAVVAEQPNHQAEVDADLFSGVIRGRLSRQVSRFDQATAGQAAPTDLAVATTQTASTGAVDAPSLFRLNVVVPTAKQEDLVSPRTSKSQPQAYTSSAQEAHPVEIITNLNLQRISGADITIDGQLNESVWNQSPALDRMIVVEPDTLVEPSFTTHTRIFYTETGLYVAADMVQPHDTLVQRLSARDKDLNRDGFAITIDTSGQGLFGFWFAINLGDSKEDGKVLPERNFSREWDGAWQGATSVTDKGWSAEIFIPWSIIAMPPGEAERRMNFFVSRKVAHLNERYGWPALPFTGSRFMSALQPMHMQDVNPKQQWEAFPYVTTSADGIYDEQDSKVGVNFSWRPAPNMQVSGAVNPDFGAVESDDVVVNLTAYETYFPEKRFFFLEGSEVFQTTPRSAQMRGSSFSGSGARVAPSTYNPEPTAVVNTRRIGGAARHLDVPDGITIAGPEQSRPTDLLGAVKVVGQTDQVRFGVLGALEDDVELRAEVDETEEEVLLLSEGRDFGIARVLWDRPMQEGRQSHGYIHTFVDTPEYEAMVHGLDSHFLANGGKMSIDTQLLHSDVEDELGYGGFADIRYTPKQGTFHRISFDYLDDKLNISDMGFLRRNDLQGFRYTRFNNVSKGLPSYLRGRNIGVFSAAQVNQHGELINGYLGTGFTFYFNNQSTINMQYSYRPSLVDDRSSYGNGAYETESGAFAVVTYGTDSSKKFSYSVQVGKRDDELGDPAYFADFGITVSPVTRFTFDYDIRLRDSKGWVLYSGDSDFTRYFSEQLTQIISLDLFFTARQQFRTTLQWTGVDADERDFWLLPEETGPLLPRMADPMEDPSDFTISRLAAQVRYRWEIAPLSDLFVVYTRGANITDEEDESFGQLFSNAIDEAIVDKLIVKLRYRFGS